ncbi:ComEC/Rec2 family competence protein [Brevibacterium litoralis]|uniref:ComEC/Rec2 family competence protein n=1 Tax=Brevibacterium litoralis TaxID=3138935 RepID=UPI0032ECC6EF
MWTFGARTAGIRALGVRAHETLRRRAWSARILLVAGAVWLACLVPWTVFGRPAVVLGAIGAVLGVGCGVLHRRRGRSFLRGWIASTGVLLACGLVVLGVSVERDGVRPGTQLDVPGTVVTDPVTGPTGFAAATVRTTQGSLTVRSRTPLPPAGSRFRVVGSVTEDGDLFLDEAPTGTDTAVGAAPPSAHWQVRAHIRAFLTDSAQRAATRVAAVTGGTRVVGGAALLPGLVIGDTAAVDAGLEQDMRTVSLSHLTAVSGSNITIVSVMVMWVVGRVTIRRGVGIGAALVVTAGYVFVVGPEPSVLRAAAMGLVGAVVLVRGMGTPAVAVLGSAVAFLLVVMPRLATEVAFHLSVVATLGLVVLGVPATRSLVERGIPYPVAAALTVPVCAQVSVTPVLLGIGGTLSPWSVLANVLAMPAVAPATVLGTLVLALGLCAAVPVGAVGAVCGVIAGFVAVFPVLCAAWIVRVARVAADLPAAVWPWPDPPVGIVLAVLATLCLAGAVLGTLLLGPAPLRMPATGAGGRTGSTDTATAGADRENDDPPEPLTPEGRIPVRRRRIGHGDRPRPGTRAARQDRRIRAVCAGAFVLVLLVGSLWPLVFRVRVGDWEVAVCDVGQGSATLLAGGSEGHALVVDTGRYPDRLRECLRTFGVGVAHLVVSHYDADHVAGYPGLLTSTEVVGVHHGPGATGRAAEDLAEAVAPVAPVAVHAGHGYEWDGITWDYLWPESDTVTRPDHTTTKTMEPEDRNGVSLLVHARTPGGVTVVLPGDLGAAELTRLVATMPRADVLAAPHHGSGDMTAAFHRAVGARLGVVSVGADNSYGHPHPDALDAFGSVPVLRTDECGSLVVDGDLRARGLDPVVPGLTGRVVCETGAAPIR